MARIGPVYSAPYVTRNTSRTSHAGAVVMLDEAGRVLLLRRGSTAPWMPGHWNLPGGMADPGETPEETAVREAQEEIGLTPHDLRLIHVDHGVHGRTYIFIAGWWTGRPKLTWENDAAVWAHPCGLVPHPMVPGLVKVMHFLAHQSPGWRYETRGADSRGVEYHWL